MRKITAIIPDYVEDALRNEVRGKGDISKIVTKALIKFLEIPKQQCEPIQYIKEKEA